MTEAILTVRNIYSRNRSLLLLVTKILTAAGLMLFVIYSANISQTISVFTKADKYFLSAAFVLSFVNIYLQYLKWQLVCGCFLEEYERGKIISSLFYGFAAGSFTPARIGEYVGRAMPFAEKPLLKVSSAVFIDKLFSLIIVFLFGSVSFLFFLNLEIQYTAIIIILVGLLSYLLIQGAAVTPYVKRIITRQKWSSDLFSGFTILKNSSSEFKLKLIVLSLLFYVCFIIQFALLVSAFSHYINFTDYIWSGNLVMFVKTIIPSISFGELGIREGASVYFLKKVGVAAAAGFNASIFLFFINVLLPAITGLILMMKRK